MSFLYPSSRVERVRDDTGPSNAVAFETLSGDIVTMISSKTTSIEIKKLILIFKLFVVAITNTCKYAVIVKILNLCCTYTLSFSLFLSRSVQASV